MMAKVPVPGPNSPSYSPMPRPMASASAALRRVNTPSSRFSSGSLRRHRITTAATGRMMNIIVRSASSEISSTICAPSALPAKLPAAARSPTGTFMAPLRKKLAVAKVVPQAALSLLVP